MTSSHTMSSFKSRRFDSVAKSSSLHSVEEARVKFKVFGQSAISDRDESNEEVRYDIVFCILENKNMQLLVMLHCFNLYANY